MACCLDAEHVVESRFRETTQTQQPYVIVARHAATAPSHRPLRGAQRIGEGGMGALFLALDPAIDRLVALKLLRVDNEETRARFLREARSAGRLQHPHIVTVYDVGEHLGQPFIAMEYVKGETLGEVISRRAPLSIVGKLTLMEDLCAGLDYAHTEGLVHRDIKPANLMVTNGTDG